MALAPAPVPAAADAISIHTSSVSLNSEDSGERRVGALIFLGGLSLRAADARFGGFSGLHVSADGTKMLAISDMGYWLQAVLAHDKDGALTGVHGARLSPMLGLDGKPVTGKRLGDAEGLFVSGDGIYVSFERQHRIWRYPLTEDLAGAVPAALPAPGGIAAIRSNKGLEALAGLPGGAMLMLTEESLDDQGNIRGWLGAPGGGSYAPIRLRRDPPFAATGAAPLPGGEAILILERRYSRIGGLGIKLRRVAVSAIAPNALLTGRDVAEFSAGQNIDNFEGIATRADAAGDTTVYLLSDDNFNAFQRTLLLQFRLADQPAG